SHASSTPQDGLSASPSPVGCTTSMPGFDLRQAQEIFAPADGETTSIFVSRDNSMRCNATKVAPNRAKSCGPKT
ncbi:MAG: hypothetical protein K8H87_04140, partial [Pseudorhodoplanes sp.]|nr:hypothetical protein [Pseudorhodoplanes sp.]